MPDQNTDSVWMQPPDGSDPVLVSAEDIGPKMFQGYRQVEAPAAQPRVAPVKPVEGGK